MKNISREFVFVTSRAENEQVILRDLSGEKYDSGRREKGFLLKNNFVPIEYAIL